MAEEYKFGTASDKLIEEVNLEFKEKMENYVGNLLIENKLFKIAEMIDLHLENTCGYLIEKVKFFKKSNNFEEMDTAIKKLETCKKPYDNLMREHRNIQKIFNIIFHNQNFNCVKECQRTFGENDEIKPCLKECLNKFEKYTLTAFGELYSNYLDDVNENLMKAI